MEGNSTWKNDRILLAAEVRSCLCRRSMEWSLGRIKTQSEGTGADVCLRESAACMEEVKCSTAGGDHGIGCSELHCLFSSAYLDLTGKGTSHWYLTEHCAGLSMWRWMSVLETAKAPQQKSICNMKVLWPWRSLGWEQWKFWVWTLHLRAIIRARKRLELSCCLLGVWAQLGIMDW